jgi:hypothetical protein
MSHPHDSAMRTAVAVLVGGIAVILDATIVSVALHELATDLNTDVSTIQWVSTAYLPALGVAIPTVGWQELRGEDALGAGRGHHRMVDSHRPHDRRASPPGSSAVTPLVPSLAMRTNTSLQDGGDPTVRHPVTRILQTLLPGKMP